jgi:oligopeptide transport system permease protein
MLKMNDITLTQDLFVRIDASSLESEKLDIQPYSFWKSVFTQFFKSKAVIVCLGLLLILIFFVIFGPMMHYYSKEGFNPLGGYALPSAKAWFGTDGVHKDIWTEVWMGGRSSILLALVVTAINTGVGLITGAIWGYFRKTDPFFTELRNIITNIPQILFQMVLITVSSFRGFGMLVFALCIFSWIFLAGIVRNLIINYSNRDYNIASRTLGTASFLIILNNILPYLLSVIVQRVAASIPGVISSEVGLTYFGLGFKGGQKSLGAALYNGYTGQFIAYPHILLFPALIIGVLSGTLYFIGVKLADATDPKTHR